MKAGMAQTTCNVLMIRPSCFGRNAETAASNAFQQACSAAPDTVRANAIAEFDGAVEALREAGVRVFVADDVAEPAKPDAVFPNNWASFHENGDVIVYPLAAASRRPERRPAIVDWLGREGGFRVRRVVDLSWLEANGEYLEGTGSLVLDRLANVGYAALSSRTCPAALREFTRQTGIEVVSFATNDGCDRPVYHTNVILSIGTRFAVVCADAVADKAERDGLLRRLAATGRRIIEIDLSQMRRFAGNVLELETAGRGSVIAMSAAARDAFSASQFDVLEQFARPVVFPLDTIEQVGGGSARCMLAEIFLPPAGQADRHGS